MNLPSQEFKLLKSLQSILTVHSPDYEIEIGDDAAVRKISSDKLIITTDLSVEKVHFVQEWMTFEEIGYKAMVSNVSDCASMGARPESALVNLIFPRNDTDIDRKIESIYKGFNNACEQWNFAIIGGDLSSGSEWAIGITLIGKVPVDSRVLTRRGVFNGDFLWLTGFPGLSAAGLAALQKWGRKGVPVKYQRFLDAHVRPQAQINFGEKLRISKEVHSAMDLSDGLSKDCRTLAYENQLGIILDFSTSHILPEMIQLSDELGISVWDWILNGGEEYELLFAASPSFSSDPALKDQVCNFYKIGTFTDSLSGVHVRNGNTITEVPAGSWDHCKRDLH
jgi:thiamine-monophosphate kinase